MIFQFMSTSEGGQRHWGSAAAKSQEEVIEKVKNWLLSNGWEPMIVETIPVYEHFYIEQVS